MRLIDADALMIELNNTKYAWQDYDAVEDALRNIPTIEAEPVVRCKDCVNWEKATVSKNGFLICPKSGMKILARKYCSDGEKRVDDGNEADN